MVERLDTVFTRLVGARLHVGLVDLHHVSAMGEQVADFLVEGLGVVHCGIGLAGVILVPGLLQHGERPRDSDLHLSIGVGLQKQQVLQFNRSGAANFADDTGHEVGQPIASLDGFGVVLINAF